MKIWEFLVFEKENFTIKKGAIFIADAHANFANRKDFLIFLQKIDKGEIFCEQLFFLGDMFDFLSDTDYAKNHYKIFIDLINKISEKKEIFYFEGNHDFNLKFIFKNIKIFDFYEQPKIFDFFGEKISICHGDNGLKSIEKLILLLRNTKFLAILNFIDRIFSYKISKSILKFQLKKQLFYNLENFHKIILPKIEFYKTKIILEGHYHQGKILNFGEKKYINLASFGVNKIYYSIQNNLEFILKENFI